MRIRFSGVKQSDDGDVAENNIFWAGVCIKEH